jgi:hypothetical protein
VLLNSPIVRPVGGCIVAKNCVLDGDSLSRSSRDASANPIGRIIGNGAVDNGGVGIKSHCTADITVKVGGSPSNLVARKGAVGNGCRRIHDPHCATLSGGFVASKGGVGNRKSLVEAIAQICQGTSNSFVTPRQFQNFIILEGAVCNTYAILGAGKQISGSAFASAFVVLKYAATDLNCARSFARIAGSIGINCAAETS